MLRKLSFILVLAMLLSACGVSVSSDDNAAASSGSGTESVSSSSVPGETVAGSSEIPENAKDAASDVSAEYFCFTKYSNTVSNDDDVDMFYENRCVPSFVSPDPQHSEWVGSVLADIDRDFNAESSNLRQYAEDYLRENGTDYFYSYSNYQQLGIARHDETIVSLISLSSLYSGGSHPNSVQTTYNMDISGQRLLMLEDVIEEASAQKLAALVQAGVDEKFAMIDGVNGLFSDYVDTIATSMDYGNMTPYWYLNDVGLVIFYNQYELGPYAAGIIKVEIPYADLKGILLEEYFPAPGDGSTGDLVLKGEGTDGKRICLTLDDENNSLLIGVEGTVYQVQISEVLWMNNTAIDQDLRFSALSLGPNDVLEISGGYSDETKSFVIEFIDGRGDHHLYHIRDGELIEEP